ncbi:MAG: hypothetical protein K6G79_00765 [Bacteroidales bacterium]|nr:hypothetical protein [Bacteroidales bacterium]
MSATAKLAGIDAFEIYVFSFGWFSLGTSFLLARLVIAAEYALGVLLIAGFCPKLAGWGAFTLLAVLSVFLVFLALNGNHDNCHCFGEWVDLSPGQSLLKNAGMLLLLALGIGAGSDKARSMSRGRKAFWVAVIASVSLAAVLIASPPDNWRYDSYSREEPVNEEALNDAVDRGILPAAVAEGRHVVCFYSLKCEFCKLSARKLHTLRSRGDFSDAPLMVIFGRGEDTDTTAFFGDTGLVPDEVLFIEPSDFLRITNGTFPVILEMDGRKISGVWSYRNLH